MGPQGPHEEKVVVVEVCGALQSSVANLGFKIFSRTNPFILSVGSVSGRSLPSEVRRRTKFNSLDSLHSTPHLLFFFNLLFGFICPASDESQQLAPRACCLIVF